MKNSTDTVRRASSYRQEAREALRGRWGAALGTCLLLVLLPFIPCALFGLLPALIPQESVAQLLAMAMNAAAGSASVQPNDLMAIIMPMITSIAAVFGGVVLLTLILQPFLLLAQAKMGVNLYTGDKVGFRVLGIGWKSYWKTVGLSILTYLAIIWPMMLVAALGSLALSFAGKWIANYSLVGNDPTFLLSLIPTVYSVLMFIMMCVTIARAFRYVPGIYLLAMHPTGPIVKIMRRSRAIMKHNKWRYFCLCLSFIGWILLNILFNAAVAAALAFIPATASLIWPIPVVTFVLALITALPLFAYQQVSIVAFICDIGNKKRRVHAD